VESVEDAVIVSKNLSSIVNEGNLTSKFDIDIVSNILENIVARSASNEEVSYIHKLFLLSTAKNIDIFEPSIKL